jgi:hypothetical protein
MPLDSEAVLWAFEYFYHMDAANAKVHCAPVKFSPITFRLHEYILSTWNEEEDITQELAVVREHLGTYDLDPGR